MTSTYTQTLYTAIQILQSRAVADGEQVKWISAPLSVQLLDVLMKLYLALVEERLGAGLAYA